LDARVGPGDTVRVIRVEREYEEVEREIPFPVVTKEDKNLALGKEKVVQEGQAGVIVELMENVYEDGRLVARRVIDSTLKSPGVEQIVAIGSKRPVTVLSARSPDIETITKGGVTFGVKNSLHDGPRTIDDVGPEARRKDEEHPLCGITVSGGGVAEGRTIAVDANAITRGWWVYIEGVGLRRAEDTGSAVKGNKSDVYFDDVDEAPFSRKRGVTVYIIGPDKPEGLE